MKIIIYFVGFIFGSFLGNIFAAWVRSQWQEVESVVNQNLPYWQAIKEQIQWNYPSKGELPECDENRQLLFCVTEWNKISASRRKRFTLGVFKKMFLNENPCVFYEQTKGFSCEYLPEEVIAWQYIAMPEAQRC